MGLSYIFSAQDAPPWPVLSRAMRRAGRQPEVEVTLDDRRKFLLAALAALTAGCGGGVEPSAPAVAGVGARANDSPTVSNPPAALEAPAASLSQDAPPSVASARTATPWSIVPEPVLVAGSAAVVFDLRTTLPADVRRGGRFEVDSSGAALPTGVTLSPDGLLYAKDSAAGTAAGVIFAYLEPT